MAENWAAIASEINAALRDAGGSVLLMEPGYEIGPDYDPTTIGPGLMYEAWAVDDVIRRRDSTGAVTTTTRVLTISATGVAPAKGWTVRIGDHSHRIAVVNVVSPAGVDVLYELELEG